MNTNTTSSDSTIHVDWTWHKPLGRGRRFDRLARGLARRLRIPFVREILRERDNPGHPFRAVEYGQPWTSNHALANFSFACTCHPNERYSRKGRRGNEPDAPR